MRIIPNLDYSILKKYMNRNAAVEETPEERELRENNEDWETIYSIPEVAAGGGIRSDEMDLFIERKKYELEINRAKTPEEIEQVNRRLYSKLSRLKKYNAMTPARAEELTVPAFQKWLTEEKGLKKQKIQEKHEELEGKPLEDQLQQAIKEERYEDAQKMHDDLTRFQKLINSKLKILGMSRPLPTELTPRQKEILLALQKYIAENGFPPSLRNLSNAFGMTSMSMRDHLIYIEKKGYIERVPGQARGIRVIKPIPGDSSASFDVFKDDKGIPPEPENLEGEPERSPEEWDMAFDTLFEEGKVIETITITAENLNLVIPDKPYDVPQDVKTRRHRFRFRNEPEGQDELFWDGMAGYRNTDKGIGTDQYQDVGSPSSISLANEQKPSFGSVEWQAMMVAQIKEKFESGNEYEDLTEEEQSFIDIQKEHNRKMTLNSLNSNINATEIEKKIKINPFRANKPGMPNEKMERDPMQELETTDTWREFNDMQMK